MAIKNYLIEQYKNNSKLKINHSYLVEQFHDYKKIFKKIEKVVKFGDYTLGSEVDNFEKNALLLIDQVSRLSSKELDKDFADKKYGSIRRNINVLIEHSYYHLGQMVLIQKMIKSNNK